MKSQPVALLGEAPPRVLVEPKGVRANSWADVADLSAKAGITLDAWQETILRVSMGERSDATWAAKRVGVSVARQNGKSQLLVARALAGVLLFGEKKIVISAHQQDTAREAFSKMVEILEADGNEWLMARVKPNGIMNAYARETIKFRNGATIQFKARTASGGRGFSSDCLLLDEAQRLKRSAWVSINSTMSAMPNPQVWLLGTPPTRDDVEAGMSEVFESIRSAAREGVSTAAAWAEWAADPLAPGFDPADEYTRWSGNPAWNTRINHEVVQGEFESYTPEEFSLDRLGIWLSEITVPSVIKTKEWSILKTDSPPDGEVAYGVRFSVDGSRVALSAAVRSGESVHVELIDVRSMAEGTEWLVDWLVEREGKSNMFVLDGKSHRDAVVNALAARRFKHKKLLLPTTEQVVAAHAMFLQAVISKNLSHFNDSTLNASVAAAAKRQIGTAGGWGWKPIGDGDVTPLESATLAHYGALIGASRKQRTGAAVFR